MTQKKILIFLQEVYNGGMPYESKVAREKKLNNHAEYL